MRHRNCREASAVARALALAAALAFSASASAQECSGGPAGGADATGNQCNNPPSIEATPGTPGATGATTLSVKTVPAKAAPAGTMTPAAHRKQVFDERRARFEGPGRERVAAAAPQDNKPAP